MIEGEIEFYVIITNDLVTWVHIIILRYEQI